MYKKILSLIISIACLLSLLPCTQATIYPGWEKHVIGQLINPIYVYVKDIDGDGDLDVATTTNIHPGVQPSDVAWFQNNLNQGQPWERFLVRDRNEPNHLNSTLGVIVADIDGDTHEDIVVATGVINLGGVNPHGEVHWLKAPADPMLPGAVWEDFMVDTTDSAVYAKAYIVDVNNDGNKDIIVSGEPNAVLFLNPGSPEQPGAVWKKAPLYQETGAGMFLDDLNEDGTTDIINSVRAEAGNVSWINILCDGVTANISFERTVIDAAISSPFDVCSMDVNEDLKKDVIASAVSKENPDEGSIVWYEAPVNTGDPWRKHTVAAIKAADLYPGDIDGDGKSDFITSALFENKVSWFQYEINGGEVSWVEHVIDDNINIPGDISLNDIDGDGDLDAVTTVWNGGEIVWYENHLNDDDNDGIINKFDNCPNQPNGPFLGTCSNGPKEKVGIATCTSNVDCNPNGFCSMNQEDTDGDGTGDACDRNAHCPVIFIYGNHSEETEILRYFRDHVLSQTQEGQELIKLYYLWSPTIVRAMECDEEFKEEVKGMIDSILPMIEKGLD